MRCKKVLERLDDHVDGLLAAREAEAIRDHLDACADCRETSFALKAAAASLSAWHDAEPPAHCFDRIMTAIDALPPEALSHRSRRGLLAWLSLPESMHAARARWMLTSGLAAAAAVMAAVLLTRVEPQRARRIRVPWAADAVSVSASPWFQGYDFDDSLLYRGGGQAPTQRALVQFEPR